MQILTSYQNNMSPPEQKAPEEEDRSSEMAVWLEEMAKSLGRWMKVEECGRRLLRVFIRCSGHPTTATLCSPSTVMILWPLSLIFLITFLPHLSLIHI